MQGLSDGRWAHGGRLPHGATRATVARLDGTLIEAVAGFGAWLYVTAVERHRLPVRFTDDDGGIVRPELPAQWPREPVHDATETCPACAGEAWEYIVALDGSRGQSSSNDGPMENNGVVVCVCCGYEISTGVFYAPLEDDTRTEQEQQEDLERFQAEEREREQTMLANLDFVVVAAAGAWPAGEIGGHGSSDNRTTSVTVQHTLDDRCWLRIQTLRFEEEPWSSAIELARGGLISAVHEFGEWPGELSEPALSLWLDAREGERNAAVAAAEEATATVHVEGTPVGFTVLDADGAWSAAADHGDLRIVLTGRGVPLADLRLQPYAPDDDEAGTSLS
ncbi:MAG: hypothetical protein WKF94_15200 [Solirubrobacteraceae bacterium]